MTYAIKKIITGILLAIAGHFIYFFTPVYITSLILISVPFFIFIFEWPQLLNAFVRQHSKVPRISFTLLYLITPFVLMVIVNEQQPRWLLLLFFYIVFMNDIGGYIIGSLFGKHKLSRYSPNKSWEGVIGGFLFSGIAAYSMLRLNNISLPTILFFILVIGMTISSVLGDLFESYLKRLAEVKDSGSWLPGHGGLLDRFDSCMIAIFTFYAINYYTASMFFLNK